MIEQQDTNKKGYKYFHQAKVKVKVQNDARYFDKIIPLNENQAFIYFDGGEYHLYDMASEQVVGQGQIIHDVKCFYQIYPQTLCFLDPEDMKVKLLDLQTHQVNEQFVFAASNIVSQNSDKQIKEKLAYKFCIMMINRKQNNVQYLITQDLEKYYSNNTVCHFAIRILPLNYTHETQFDLNPVFEYHYPIQLIMKNCIIGRLTKKRQLFMDKTLKLDRQKSYQLNHIQSKMHSKLFILRQTYLSHQQTLLTGYINIQLLYGSIIMMVFRSQPFLQLIQFTVSFYYIFVIKPILLQLFNLETQVRKTKDEFRATLQDLIIMVKNGYLNQNVFQLKQISQLCISQVMDTAQEIITFMDIYQFHLCQTYVCQFRLIVIDPVLSLINYANVHQLELNDEIKVHDFFHEFPSNKAYILTYQELEQILYVHLENSIFYHSIYYELILNEFILECLNFCNIRVIQGFVEFSLIYPYDLRYQWLQIMEKVNLIDLYGIYVIEEVVDFLIQ